ncbi:ribosome maturation factor RimM [Acidomonas methanolica]|uniref:Ribosome maturation factor RimM n=1 Tax=Acidomonas methanolica NBRC 104435 TaxID=1231351 RepID=A0A023D6C6_ACIMT|nr:ribosome maturation factor RimM [Acidomonas methanolica]MBU2655474.1 ribosome maturation factor RimM [Acidomonas methanolica]TCS21730.1 16S rRNA processing protein RimM [Acidomonas methanolica]GAJ29654.1 ribosomal RNA 16S processing protein RimM [Acidomonas methanolica NBRC 104435]GBQ52091.1 ribosomal RNA small subunit 16S rRNA processing protein RimM [Acidomonas methanolica]GEL00332.1 ribosome maturation factor RimM [Acidomonas methanolica NBRC 104435]
MTAPFPNAILVATVGRPHGVRGLVRLHAATEDPATIEALGDVRDAQGRAWRVEWRGSGIAALFDADGREIADRDAAARLTNLELFVARERLPDPDGDEFYHVDLIGLAAVTPEGEALGVVNVVHDYGAGVSLEIAGARSLIVPFTKRCVPEIDLPSKRLVVVPPVEIEVEGDPSGPGDVAVRA